MSIYDKSSLVLIPSGTKTGKVYSQKPVSGDGDFTFTRSSAATRVNADGNIEKETSNLLLQSNSFNTTWVKVGYTLTSGQSGYDGTNDAWLANCTGAGNALYQTSTASGVSTFSIYVKAGTASYARLRADQTTDAIAVINLTDGSVESESGTIKTTATDVGGGWYRCAITWNIDTLSNVQIRPSNAAGNAITGTLYIQDAQLNQGLIAQEVITTTTAAVEGGITDNVPRLDYTDSSCPALLLEPQRTNTITGSEYFDGGSLINTAITAEYNTADTLSPEGLYNAAKLTAASNFPRYYDFPTIGDNVNVTLSSFAKAGTASVFTIRAFNKNNETAVVNFDLSAGTAELSQYDELTPNFDIVDMGNGWYRCSISTNTGSGATAFQIRPISHAQAETGGWSGTNYIYAYGAQMEQDASYATSYIPTYGTSVTRNQCFANKTGVSSLIGQSEGTLFLDFQLPKIATPQNHTWMALKDSAQNNRILVYFLANSETLRAQIKASGSADNFNLGTISNGDRVKIAIAYKSGDSAIYVNGSSSATSTNALSFGTMDIIDFTDASSPFEGDANEMLVFPTRLSNEELAALTTI